MIGFDIGGTKCAVSIGQEEYGQLRILEKRIIATKHTVSPYVIIDEMCSLAEEMTDDYSAIGISCGGPLNSKQGIILSPPNLPGWDEVRIVDYLKKRYGGEVGLANDANACALAEWRYGAGKGTQNMVFLTFGSGMGAGLIIEGKLYAGSCDMAGEVGHIRLSEYGPVGYGKTGSFEGFCSGNGIAALGRLLAEEQLQMGRFVSYCKNATELSQVTAKSIAEHAKNGCADALQVYEICGRKLGLGISILIDILNPEMVVVGSVYERSEELLKTYMEEVLDRECLSISKNACRVVPAALGDKIGDYAALSVAAMIKENKR